MKQWLLRIIKNIIPRTNVIKRNWKDMDVSMMIH